MYIKEGQAFFNWNFSNIHLFIVICILQIAYPFQDKIYIEYIYQKIIIGSFRNAHHFLQKSVKAKIVLWMVTLNIGSLYVQLFL